MARRQGTGGGVLIMKMPAIVPFLTLVMMLVQPAAAQDIRGLEVCSAEKQMERRTGCLQANIELLSQALAKLARDTNNKLNDARSDIAAARAEIAALKSALAKLDSELAQMRSKAEPPAKK
jgi:septal ring factor EnvC (AmiA/AmiB activator)